MKQIDSSRQIKLGALMSYVTIGFYILAGLIYTPWIVQNIGKSDYGLYTLANSLIAMFLLDFGISSAVTRFVSKYNAEGEQEKVNNLLGIVYKLYFIIDFIIFLVLCIVYFNIDNIYLQLTVKEISRFKIVYAIAAVFNLISFPFVTLNGILTAYEEFVPMKFIDLLNKLFTVVTTVAALLIGGGLYALVTINAVWNLIAIAAKLKIIKRNIAVKVNFKYQNKEIYKEVFGFSIWVAIISVCQNFIFNITPSILGAISGSASIAIFGLASTIEGYVYTFASAINGMFLPKVSRIVAKDEEEHKEILPLMIKVGRIQLLIIGLIIVGFFSVGRSFVILWMGENYQLVYYCAVVTIVPSIFSLTQEIANTTIIAVNKVKYQAFVYICMAIINIVLSLIFTHFWGVFGASLSIFLAYMIRTAGMNILYYRELNIDVFHFFKECHIKMAPALIIILGIGILIDTFIPINGWLGLLFKIILIIMIYIVIMWIFVMNEYEKNLFGGIAKKLFQRITYR